MARQQQQQRQQPRQRSGNGANRQVVKSQADTVRAALEKLKPQLALALPKHVSADRLLRVVMTAVQNNPKLLECDRTSLYAAVMTCGQLGLEPDSGPLGQAYLVPFWSPGGMKVQTIVGYKGYLTLARNSGELSSINAHAVREGDDFSYSYGLDEHLHHVPADDNEDAEITHFYAYAKFKDGGHVFVVLTRAKVDRIRDTKSEGYRAFREKKIKSTPWDSDYEAMGLKTAIRRLAKFLPLSVQRAAALDAAYEEGKHANIDDFGDVVIEGEAHEVEPEQEQPATDKAASKLDALAGEDKPEPDPAQDEVRTSGKQSPPRRSKRFVIESGEVVDTLTAEIVPERYVDLHDDGTFSVREKEYSRYLDAGEAEPERRPHSDLFRAEA